MVLNKLADMREQVSAICAVFISFRDEGCVSIQYCLDKMFVSLMDIYEVGFVGDEVFNMLFK